MMYMDDFQNSYYQCSFSFESLESSEKNKKIIERLIEVGEETDVDFFFINKDASLIMHNKINVYGTDGAIKELRNNNIDNGFYDSVFLGTVDIYAKPIKDIENIRQYTDCYFIGDIKDTGKLNSFKAKLIDEYGGGFPKLIGSQKEIYRNITFAWTIIFLFMLLLTLYEVNLRKKEIAVKAILGENIALLSFHKVAEDTMFYAVAFFVLSNLYEIITHSMFLYSYLIRYFFVFVVLNALFLGSILRIDFKSNLSSAQEKTGIQIYTYILKFTSCMLLAVLLASNLAIIEKGVNTYQQNDFFYKHKDFCYYKMFYRVDNHKGANYDVEDDEKMNRAFFERFQRKALQYDDLTNSYFENVYPMVLVNKAAMDEVCKHNNELRGMKKEFGKGLLYVLIPNNIRRGSDQYEYMREVVRFIADKRKLGMVEKEYSSRVQIIGIDNNISYKSKLYTKPIIVYADVVTETGSPYSIMYDINDDEFQKFIKDYELEEHCVGKTSVEDIYLRNRKQIYREMLISSVVSLFLLFLEGWLIAFIIRMEYSLNAVQLALKKIYGYTLLERNRRIIKLNVGSFIVSTIIVLLINYKMQYHLGIEFLFIELILLAGEMMFVYICAKEREKLHVVSTLKGERR